MRDPEFRKILARIPPRTEPHLPSNWLQNEMLERLLVLSHSGVMPGQRILEVGSGAHALTTVPLAFLAGESGRVVAVELERWQFFNQVVSDSRMKSRIDALECDARQLPIRSKCFNMAAIVHGIRSMRNEETMLRILSEMIRVASRIFVAESLPIARTKAQAAHLEMYNLREEIFESVLGSKDDIHYLHLETLESIVENAGGKITHSRVLEINLPHYLGFIPREYVEKIQDPVKKKSLLSRWEIANQRIIEYGEEHPPVGLVMAEANC